MAFPGTQNYCLINIGFSLLILQSPLHHATYSGSARYGRGQTMSVCSLAMAQVSHFSLPMRNACVREGKTLVTRPVQGGQRFRDWPLLPPPCFSCDRAVRQLVVFARRSGACDGGRLGASVRSVAGRRVASKLGFFRKLPLSTFPCAAGS